MAVLEEMQEEMPGVIVGVIAGEISNNRQKHGAETATELPVCFHILLKANSTTLAS